MPSGKMVGGHLSHMSWYVSQSALLADECPSSGRPQGSLMRGAPHTPATHKNN